MGRKVKDAALQNRESRRGLKVRNDPYWRLIAEGLHIGYRKGKRAQVWQVRRAHDGKYAYRTLGLADDVLDADGTEVLNWAQAQEAAQAFDRDAKESGGIIRKPLTVAEATAQYLEWFRANRKGVATAEGFINAHILPAFANVEVAALTTEQIERWKTKVADTPARLRTGKLAKKQAHREKPATEDEKRARKATTNRVLTVLKAILNRAFKQDKVADDSAWRRVKPFDNIDDGEIRHLSPEESTRLVNACPPDLRELVRGALYTGARFGELARMTVNHVNVEDARVFITAASKSGKARHVPLSAEGATMFADLCAGRDGAQLVFRKADGTAWGHNHHMRAFVKANADAHISPPARFHDLRHSYATMIANIHGNTLDVLSEILGHADSRITRKHYAHLFDETKRRAVVNLPSLGYSSPGIVKAIKPRTAAKSA